MVVLLLIVIQQFTGFMKKGMLANARVSKILDMSRDFQAHRNNIMGIENRRSEDRSVRKRATDINKMLEQKNRYFCNVESLKLRQLQRQNDKIVKRLEDIHKRDPRKLSKSNSNLSIGSIRMARSNSSKSLNNTFRRSESRRIVRENGQLANRIIGTKPRELFKLNNLKRDYSRQQQYVRSISRYSQKNRAMLTSIVQKGLKLKRKEVNFLPNILNTKTNLTGRSSRV